MSVMMAFEALPTRVTFVLVLLVVLKCSLRARRWTFAVLWHYMGLAAYMDWAVRSEKGEILHKAFTGGGLFQGDRRVLDVGSGDGCNLKYIASETTVTEIVCVEPNHVLLPALRAAAAHAMKQRADLTVTIFAGSLAEYEAAMVVSTASGATSQAKFDHVTCLLVLCSVGSQEDVIASAVRFMKDGTHERSSLVFLEHVCGQGLALQTIQRAVQPLWNLFGDGCCLHCDTGACIASNAELRDPKDGKRCFRRFSIFCGLLPIICGEAIREPHRRGAMGPKR